jgi:hypothetical protein
MWLYVTMNETTRVNVLQRRNLRCKGLCLYTIHEGACPICKSYLWSDLLSDSDNLPDDSNISMELLKPSITDGVH